MAVSADLLTQPPLQTGGELDGSGNFALVHGTAEVPGVRKPVEYTASIPENPMSRLMHIIVPGFGGIKHLSRGLRNNLAGQEGLSTLSYEPARASGSLIRDLLDPQQVHVDTLTAIVHDLAASRQLHDAPGGDTLDLDEVALLAQSGGGLPGTEWARKHPDETRSVIYLGSVGLEEQVMFGFVPRLVASMNGDAVGKFAAGKLVPGVSRLAVASRVARFYGENPPRTLGEMVSYLRADVRKPVRLLPDLGIKTGALYFEDDRLVPAEEELVQATREMVHICEVLENLGHLAPQRRSAEVAAAIGDVSSRLEEM